MATQKVLVERLQRCGASYVEATTLIIEARRLGFEQGREASAKVADGYGDRSTTPGDQTVWHAIGKVIGQDIRALKPGE